MRGLAEGRLRRFAAALFLCPLTLGASAQTIQWPPLEQSAPETAQGQPRQEAERPGNGDVGPKGDGQGSIGGPPLSNPEAQKQQGSSEHAASKDSHAEAKGFWDKVGDDPVAYFTVWLAAFTGILAVATVILGAATVALWLATRRLVKGAEDTSERQLRAYLLVEEAQASVNGQGRFVVDITVMNYGQT